MPRKAIGPVILLGVSEVLGLVLGQWFYSLFLKTLPPLALSNFNQGTAHAAFLVYGALSGLAIFALALAATFLSRFFPAASLDERVSPPRP